MSSPHVLTPPREIADSIVLIDALTAPEVLPGLVKNFVPEAVQSVIVRARGLMVEANHAAIPSADLPEPSEYAQRLRRGFIADALRQSGVVYGEDVEATGYQRRDGQDEATLNLVDMLIEPEPFALDEIRPFDVAESAIALSAVRRAAHTKGYRRVANDFLSRNAPNPLERSVRRVATRVGVRLAQFA